MLGYVIVTRRRRLPVAHRRQRLQAEGPQPPEPSGQRRQAERRDPLTAGGPLERTTCCSVGTAQRSAATSLGLGECPRTAHQGLAPSRLRPSR
jgi:hypothetical protein